MSDTINKPKALIAMSGGVDSSVAARLTLEAGYDCLGCIMKLFNKEDSDDHSKDIEDARRVAESLSIPFYVCHYEEEFKDKIICGFIASYEAGITPNPCVDCNHYMKFGKLLEKGFELGCEVIVTGHYARITKDENNHYHLLTAMDPTKDQSYVLYSLTQEQLAHICFPLGEMSKADARKLAAESGFLNADRPDSQDICFVPNGDYAAVIEKYTGRKPLPGDFVGRDGRVLGRHKGIIHYTIGQRRGLGLSVPESVYVCQICPENNTVILGSNEDLFSTTVYVKDFNWIAGQAPSEPIACEAKIRYRQAAKAATVTPLGNDQAIIEFAEPQRAITPGQSAVLYQGNEVLGGGKIVPAL